MVWPTCEPKCVNLVKFSSSFLLCAHHLDEGLGTLVQSFSPPPSTLLITQVPKPSSLIAFDLSFCSWVIYAAKTKTLFSLYFFPSILRSLLIGAIVISFSPSLSRFSLLQLSCCLSSVTFSHREWRALLVSFHQLKPRLGFVSICFLAYEFGHPHKPP